MKNKKTIKISYFNAITENKLDDEDAYCVAENECLEELFYLEEDNESYVRIFTDKNNYQIIGEDYDSYKLFEYSVEGSRYMIIQRCNFEALKDFVKQLYSDAQITVSKETPNNYVNKDGSRFYKDENGNRIADN